MSLPQPPSSSQHDGLAPADEPRAVTLPRVFVIGDSITVQFGPHLETSLVGRARYDRKRDAGGERAEDNLDIPRGANGGDSTMVLAYLKQRRGDAPLPEGVLLLNCGLHDIKTSPLTGAKQVPLQRYRENLAAILHEAAAMRQRVVWLSTPPVVDAIHNGRLDSFHRFAADVEAYNAAADEIMTAADAAIIDLHAFCQRLGPDALIDHVHYNENARTLQAEFVARELISRVLC